MSDLLNSASLVMIPSGYKEDIVYSEVPTNGNGDLSFTRASNGTRVNSAGLVEVCPWNFVQYSEEFNNAIYVVRSGVTITDNATTAPNGTSTADLMYINASGNFRYTAQTFTQPSNIYTISVYAKAQNKSVIWMYMESSSGYGLIYFDLSDGTMQTTAGATSTPIGTMSAVGNGWYRCTYTLGESVSLASGSGVGVCDAKGSVYGTANGTDGVYVWGFQFNIGSTAKPYFPTTDRLNVPRLTYQNGGGGCPSLLLEKQSTNLITYSEDLAQASWLVAQLTVTSNATTSPDGTQNADKIAINNGLVGGYIYQSQSTTSSTIYTGSFFVKSAGIGFTKFWSSVSGSYCNAIINLSTGVITNGASPFPTIPTATNFGNGWWRVSYTETSGGGSVPIYVDGGSTSNGGDITGNGTDGVYLWGAQLEASSYPTSYIPTTSSSATRVADACSKTGISSLIGQSEGTFFVEFIFNSKQGMAIQIANSSSYADAIYLERNGDTSMVLNCYYGGVQQVGIQTNDLVDGQSYKVAVAYKSNDFAFYKNGLLVGSDSSANLPTSLNDLYVGGYGGASGYEMTIKQVALFKTRLTNAELAQLTA